MRYLITCLTTLFLASRALAADPVTPGIVKGTIEHPVWTGWVRDWCANGAPAKEFSCTSGDVVIGGEIYRARLTHPVDVNGHRLREGVIIGYPAHALPTTYRKTQYLVLQPAPPDFTAATGIKFIAADYGGYDPKARCVVDGPIAHLDGKKCPDRAFHEAHEGKCVPLAEYLEHYLER